MRAVIRRDMYLLLLGLPKNQILTIYFSNQNILISH